MEFLILLLVLVGAWGWHQHRAAKRTARAVERLAEHIAGPLPPEPPAWREWSENRATLIGLAKRSGMIIGSAAVGLLILAFAGHEMERSNVANETAANKAALPITRPGKIKPGYVVRARMGSSMQVCTIAAADEFSTGGPVIDGEWVNIEITAGPNRGCKGVVLP